MMTQKNILCLNLLAALVALPVQAAELRMDRTVCEYVTKHVPDADVDYQPGVDVSGKRVAPADLNSGQQKQIEDQFVIRLTNDAARVWGLNLPRTFEGRGRGTPMVEAEGNVGFVTLKNGKAYLNDQPLDATQQDELAVLCMGRK
jgi:hypothetical protein